MSQTLSLSLRPKSFNEFIGNPSVTAAIQKQLASGVVPRAFMFSGPPGTGKTTLSLIVGRLVQGPNFPKDADIELIEHNAADLGGVDDVRELVRSCGYRPFSGLYRVVVLNEAQQLTGPAQNVLLQPLEEEAAATVYILTTTDPTKIIQPLQDRCTHFRLKPLSAEVEIAELIERASQRLRVPTDYDFIAHAVNSGVGSPRVLLQAYEKFVGKVPLKECFTSASHEPIYKEVAIAVCNGNWEKTKTLLAQIPTADSRAMRSIVSGFLAAELLRLPVDSKADAIAVCLLGMGTAQFEDGLAYAMTKSVFYKTCKLIGGVK